MSKTHYLTAIAHSPELDNFHVSYDEFEQTENVYMGY